MTKPTATELAQTSAVRSTFLPVEAICPVLERLDAFLSGLDAVGVLKFRLGLNERNASPEVLALTDEVLLARQACGGHPNW